jgi:hypothetical protein
VPPAGTTFGAALLAGGTITGFGAAGVNVDGD